MDRRIEILTHAQLGVLILFTVAGHFSISITHICGFLASALWLYKTHIARSWNQLRWPLALPMGGFALASVLAVLTALDPLRSFEHLKRIFEMGIFFLILNSLSDPALKTSLHALIARLKKTRLGQFCFGKPQAVVTLSARNFFIGLIVLSSTVSAGIGIVQVLVKGLSIHHRVSGTLSIYMTFAGLLMQAALAAAAYLLFRKGRNQWMWTALILMSVALTLTLTRQAWLGFGAGLFILLAVRKPLAVAALPLLAALMFWVSPAPIQKRVASLVNLDDITFQQRLTMWRLGWNIYRDYPVTGCGFHCLLQVRGNYPEHQEIARDYRTLHSNVVQLAVDAGTVGVLAWLLLWLSFFARIYEWSSRRATRSDDDPPERWVVMASFSAVIAFLVGGVFETNFYDSEVVMLTYFLMALPFVHRPSGTKPVRA